MLETKAQHLIARTLRGKKSSYGGLCDCGGLHFPHRPGSAGCRHSPNYDAHMWAKVTGNQDAGPTEQDNPPPF